MGLPLIFGWIFYLKPGIQDDAFFSNQDDNNALIEIQLLG